MLNQLSAVALVEAERDVEVLDGLSCGALHQVVDAGHHDELTARTLDAPADVAEVRVRHVLDLGQIRLQSAARTGSTA